MKDEMRELIVEFEKYVSGSSTILRNAKAALADDDFKDGYNKALDNIIHIIKVSRCERFSDKFLIERFERMRR